MEEYKIGDWIIANYENGCLDYKGKLARIINGKQYKYLDGTIEYNNSNFKFEGIRRAELHEIPVEFRNILQTIEIW